MSAPSPKQKLYPAMHKSTKTGYDDLPPEVRLMITSHFVKDLLFTYKDFDPVDMSQAQLSREKFNHNMLTLKFFDPTEILVPLKVHHPEAIAECEQMRDEIALERVLRERYGVAKPRSQLTNGTSANRFAWQFRNRYARAQLLRDWLASEIGRLEGGARGKPARLGETK